MNISTKYIPLYCSFLRLGAFTFGGGLAMLPLLRQEVVERHGWITEEELIDMYAVAQCAPGIIAVNTSVMAGYRIAGFGGVSACAGRDRCNGLRAVDKHGMDNGKKEHSGCIYSSDLYPRLCRGHGI